jgi:hypothetical protein
VKVSAAATNAVSSSPTVMAHAMIRMESSSGSTVATTAAITNNANEIATPMACVSTP